MNLKARFEAQRILLENFQPRSRLFYFRIGGAVITELRKPTGRA